MSTKIAGGVLLAALLCVPFVVRSEFWLSFWLLVLMFAFLGQAWNVLGGYGGQFSFGHALFFGGGAFGTAVLQVGTGSTPMLAGAIAIALAALVGGVHRLAGLSLPAARRVFRAGHACLRRSRARADRLVRVYRRRFRHAGSARARRREFPVRATAGCSI